MRRNVGALYVIYILKKLIQKIREKKKEEMSSSQSRVESSPRPARPSEII